MIWCDVVVRMYGKWIWDYFTLWVRFENFLKIARCNLKMLLSIKSSLTFRVITHLSYDPHSPAHLKHTLERKKFLYEGCTRQGDRSGKKTHAAVLEVHMTPQKQCETIFLLQSVFWKEWSYDKMLIVWMRSVRKGKYLALGQDARTLLLSVRTSWPRAKSFHARPSHSVNKYILLYDWENYVHACITVCAAVHLACSQPIQTN